MKKQLLRSLSFLFCLSSTLLSCGRNNTPSTNNPSVGPSINSTSKESENDETSSESTNVSSEDLSSDLSSEESIFSSSGEVPSDSSEIVTSKTYRLEFEDHELVDNNPSNDPLITEYSDKASGGKCIAYFRSGDILRFTVESSKEVNDVTLTVCAASASGMSYNSDYTVLYGISPISGDKLNDICYLNSNNVTNWSGQFNGSGNKDTTGKFPTPDYHNFSKVSTTISLKQGTNVIEFRGNSLSFNWDYIELTTTSELTSNKKITEVDGSGNLPEDGGIGATEVDVYFIAGQSNAAGCSDFYRADLKTLNLSKEYADKASTYTSGFENVYYYGRAYDISENSYTNFDVLTPVRACMGITYTHDFGAELGMAEYLNSYYAGTNKKAVIIKYAVCAAGLVTDSSAFGEWSTPSYPNPSLGNQPNLYNRMLGTSANNYSDGLLYSALGEIASKGVNKINYKGFYWSQGESDMWKDLDYSIPLTALINDIRADVNKVSNSFKTQRNVTFSDSSDLPFLISEIAPTQDGATKNADGTSSDEKINKIVSEQRKVASEMNNVSTLPTQDYDIVNQNANWKSSVDDGVSYCADQWHYNGDDMIKIGNNVGEVLYGYEVTETATVTFDGNGYEGTIAPQNVKLNQKAKKPETPKFEYTDPYGNKYNFVLENWYNGEKVWDFDKDIVTENVTLRANWTLEDSYFENKENANVRAEGTTARIMSFNVLADDWNNKPAVTDERANRGFNTIERYQPDVVGLQEFDDAWYAKSKTLLDGYKVVNIDNNKPFGATNYSTLAYNTSKVKLIEYTQVALETCNSLNNCRYVTVGTFEFIKGDNIGKRFIVSSTHWDLEETCRVKQASQFVDIIWEWQEKYPNLPTVMTGDFNTREETGSYNKVIEKSGFIDTKLEAQEKGIIGNSIHLGTPMRTSDKDYKNPNHIYRGPASFSSANILMGTCIDHIFATTDVTSLYHSLIIDEDALNASDHAPIYSDLQFNYTTSDNPSNPDIPDNPNPDNPSNPSVPDKPVTGNVSKEEGSEDEHIYWGSLS